ncbi:formyltransferase family protein [Herbaspirillum seropedicae]|uniref:formyltransferase family protein n=1 Tax=Herbaspirillum seropedicae TaxID=964 RepID=UPI00285D5FE5|nr:formyltransferase family protein [Herbaspirillum seropedicae]MDR6394418.1 methionyl-tRNA formyltransferase [Herbaspirillum seropedicae]
MTTQAQRIISIQHPRKRVLFLGYTCEQTTLLEDLGKAGCEVWHTQDKIQSTQGYDFVVSYGYRHILKKEIIESSDAPILNLHISYLPWNRGAHPNFWSFFDCTPSGVTIHLIDDGVDTGPILYQRYVNFSKEQKTFAQTYKQLIVDIEDLFREHIEEIIEASYTPRPQRRHGSYHKSAELPEQFAGWDANIDEEVRRLDELLKKHRNKSADSDASLA